MQDNLVQLYQKNFKQTSNKVRPREIQDSNKKGSSPWNSRRSLCAQKGTIFSTRLQLQVDA